MGEARFFYILYVYLYKLFITLINNFVSILKQPLLLTGD